MWAIKDKTKYNVCSVHFVVFKNCRTIPHEKQNIYIKYQNDDVV